MQLFRKCVQQCIPQNRDPVHCAHDSIQPLSADNFEAETLNIIGEDEHQLELDLHEINKCASLNAVHDLSPKQSVTTPETCQSDGHHDSEAQNNFEAPSNISRQSSITSIFSDQPKSTDKEIALYNATAEAEDRFPVASSSIEVLLLFLSKLSDPLVQDPFTQDDLNLHLKKVISEICKAFDKLHMFKCKIMIDHLKTLETYLSRFFSHWLQNNSISWKEILSEFWTSPFYERYFATMHIYHSAMVSLGLHKYMFHEKPILQSRTNSQSMFLDTPASYTRMSRERLGSRSVTMMKEVCPKDGKGCPMKKRTHFKRFTSPSHQAPKIRTTGGSHSTSYECHHHFNSEGLFCAQVYAETKMSIFYIAAILYQFENYRLWIPYCESCYGLYTFTEGQFLVRQMSAYPWPIKHKETVMYCFGVDLLDEMGAFLIVAHALPSSSDSFLGRTIPPPKDHSQRLSGSTMVFVMKPGLTEDTAALEIHCAVDLKIDVLRTILYPVIHRLVVVSAREFFKKIESIAKNFHTNEFGKLFQDNPGLCNWFKERFGTQDRLIMSSAN